MVFGVDALSHVRVSLIGPLVGPSSDGLAEDFAPVLGVDLGWGLVALPPCASIFPFKTARRAGRFDDRARFA